jgi:hypothetical protein
MRALILLAAALWGCSSSDPAVIAASNARLDGLETHWIYTAGGSGVDLGF